MGMIHANKGSNTVMAVFVIDDKAVIRAMIHYPQEISRSVREVVRLVDALQITDSKSVARPEGWPRNELIDYDVIIPPPKDTKTPMSRKKEAGCYDWWFCHKKLGK